MNECGNWFSTAIWIFPKSLLSLHPRFLKAGVGLCQFRSSPPRRVGVEDRYMSKTKSALQHLYFIDVLEWPQSECSQSSIQQKIRVSLALVFCVWLFDIYLYSPPDTRTINWVRDGLTEQKQRDKIKLEPMYVRRFLYLMVLFPEYL